MEVHMTEIATKVSDITVEEIIQIGFPVLIGLMIVALVFYAIVKNRRDAQNDAQPVLEEKAKVLDKQQLAPNAIAFESWVMFETESGKRVRLFCKPNNVYLVGDEGYLTWQGTRLYSFEMGERVTRSNPGEAGAPQGYIPAWKRVQMEEQEQK